MNIIKKLFYIVYDFISPPKKVISTIGKGGDYPTLSEWQKARSGNLNKRRAIEIAEIQGINNETIQSC